MWPPTAAAVWTFTIHHPIFLRPSRNIKYMNIRDTHVRQNCFFLPTLYKLITYYCCCCSYQNTTTTSNTLASYGYHSRGLQQERSKEHYYSLTFTSSREFSDILSYIYIYIFNIVISSKVNTYKYTHSANIRWVRITKVRLFDVVCMYFARRIMRSYVHSTTLTICFDTVERRSKVRLISVSNPSRVIIF